MYKQYVAECFVTGNATSDILFSNTSLSFWGGVDQTTGQIVDHHHPLCGQSLKGRILAIPSGRGSCTGSGVLLELLLNGQGPAALIFQHSELILTLGVIVAEVFFGLSIPVILLPQTEFGALGECKNVTIAGDIVVASNDVTEAKLPFKPLVAALGKEFRTSIRDQEVLLGSHGRAAQMAMEILIKFAQIQGAEEMLDVSQAHVDACIYIGPASLTFAQKLLSLGAKFAVPTTMNSISLDYRRWSELGIDADAAKPARALADTYMAMGAKMSFTCAPYLLESAPKAGQQIGWAESNAVVFANSILGARTQKYPDFLDVCIALTGRAPSSGCHIDVNRRPSLVVMLPNLPDLDDSAYPVIGYLIGQLAGPDIPFIFGLENTSPRTADLKAFSAAFATTASAAMFHIRGITPESASMEQNLIELRHVTISIEDLLTCYKQLNTAVDGSLGLISLGNPHFAIEEFADLARLCSSRLKHPKVKAVVTTNRIIQEVASKAGYLEILFDFGVEVITDTCWCMLDEPVIPVDARNLMTNSAKYAHYAPGMVKRGVHFGSLAQCVDASCTGKFSMTTPSWLKKAG